uniref:Ankyrin repeat domain 50 n=1 Tax=Cyclopterus lumpus TaxID=8103 RepID=A0A8C2ZEJ8_CYCLU
MAQTSLLQGKRFYCREWSSTRSSIASRRKPTASAEWPALPSGGSWGVLLLLWPASAQGTHRGMQQQSLGVPLPAGRTTSDTLCVGGFVRGLVAQICRGGLLPGYEEKVRDPAAQSALQPGECERNPTEAFKRCVLLPLLSVKPPQQSLFLVVDSIDEGCQLGEGEQRSSPGSPRTIAELLAGHHEFLPPWLLLVCSARRQNKAITKLFTGKLRKSPPPL